MSDKPIPTWRSFPPLYGHLGVQLEALTPGKCTVRLPYREELCNSAGSVHGGIVATLVDIASSQAIWTSAEGAAGVTTISLNMNYLAAPTGEITCTATRVGGGSTIAFAECELTDATGKSIAKGVAAFRVLGAKGR
jgi:acyl-CoA thioesterase